MKNKDYYANQIIEIAAVQGSIIALNMITHKLCACRKLPCRECQFGKDATVSCREAHKLWAESEHNMVDDFIHVKTDTKVYVSTDGETWLPRYFAGIYNDAVYVYTGGCTSFSVQSATDVKTWKYIKLAE